MRHRYVSTEKLQRLWHLPLHEKYWIVFLYPYSGIIRFALLSAPFRWLAHGLGQHYHNVQFSPLVSAQQRQQAWRIGRIVERIAAYTPWQSKCLVQAIMVRTLLSVYGIPYILYIGASLTKNTDTPMKAHAWVKVGPWVVSGREGHKAYAVVSAFVSQQTITHSH